MSFVIQLSSIAAWLARLFDPPPLASMSTRQKFGRVILVPISLLTLCVIVAMLLAAALFLVQKTPEMWSTALAWDFSVADKMAGIVILSIAVNAICVCVLLQVRRLDRELMNGQKNLSELLGKHGR